jgi:hypothetical protein
LNCVGRDREFQNGKPTSGVDDDCENRATWSEGDPVARGIFEFSTIVVCGVIREQPVQRRRRNPLGKKNNFIFDRKFNLGLIGRCASVFRNVKELASLSITRLDALGIGWAQVPLYEKCMNHALYPKAAAFVGIDSRNDHSFRGPDQAPFPLPISRLINCSDSPNWPTILNLPIGSLFAAAWAARVVAKRAPWLDFFVQVPSLVRNSKVTAFSMRMFNPPRICHLWGPCYGV